MGMVVIFWMLINVVAREYSSLVMGRNASEDVHGCLQLGYPKSRPGYVVDHIVPLKRGGADTPANMQWQTIAEGKAKDKIE